MKKDYNKHSSIFFPTTFLKNKICKSTLCGTKKGTYFKMSLMITKRLIKCTCSRKLGGNRPAIGAERLQTSG